MMFIHAHNVLHIDPHWHPYPPGGRAWTKQSHRFSARILAHGPLLLNLASRTCSRKTYFVAGHHRMSERPHPIDRTVRRALRNRSRRGRVIILFRLGGTSPKEDTASGEVLGRGVFRSASLT